jgi:hypothetical protein
VDHALRASGTVTGAHGWAGIGFFPGAKPLDPVDLRALGHIRFRVKGDGKTYQLIVVTSAGPQLVPFATSHAWSDVTIETAKLGMLDEVTVVMWASVAPGAFELTIDDVVFE